MKPEYLVLPLLTIMLSACAVGPAYRKPDVALPSAYSAAGDSVGGMSRSARANLATWWTRFDDPQLDELIGRALRGNLDLETAASRIREARDQVVMAGAAGLPTLNADADVNRTHLSQNAGISQIAKEFGGQGTSQGGNGSGGGIALPGGGFTSYTLGFDSSWELDVFGGVRRSVQAAAAHAEQAVWTQRDSEVSVAAEVGNDYFQLRALQRQFAIARENIASQRQLLRLVRARRKAGLVTELDVLQQRTQLALAQAALPGLHAQILAQIHALGVLDGEPPEALQGQLLPLREALPLTVNVPAGLPSELLRRRPDIRAAERALAASNADIGVAVADLYPKFNLTGMFDFISLDLKNLVEHSSEQYSATGAISWPIFSGGKVRANIRIAKERNLQAFYAYKKTVYGAMRDVEDALTRYADEKSKNLALKSALSAAQSSARLAVGQYKAGLTDYTPALTAQGKLLDARTQLAQSNGALDRDLVSVYKALGGGWGGSAGKSTSPHPPASATAFPPP